MLGQENSEQFNITSYKSLSPTQKAKLLFD